MRLVKLGFHFGGVYVSLVKVAGVSTSPKPCLSLVRLSESVAVTLTPATPALLISRSCTSMPELPWVL